MKVLQGFREDSDIDKVTQHELNRAYETFNRGLESLKETINMMNETIKEYRTETHTRYSELDQRLKTLEDERIARRAQHSLIKAGIKMYPKTFIFVCVLLCAGFVKVSEILVGEDPKREAQLQHVVQKIE